MLSEAALPEQIFSDGIGTISMTGGTVRLDLITFSPTEKDPGGQPKAVFQQRIVMTADTFLNAATKMQEAVQVLLKLAADPHSAAGTRSQVEPTRPVGSDVLSETNPPSPEAVPREETAAPAALPKRPFP